MRAIVVAVLAWGCGRVAFDGLDGLDASAGDDASVRASCANALRDGDEVGIDCGGSCSLLCPGDSCGDSADCVTGVCADGACALASGPPFWVPGPTLAVARTTLRCVADAGAIICAGGDNGGLRDEVERLPAYGTAFESLPPLLEPRATHGLAASGGLIYAACGFGPTMFLSSMERFDGQQWIQVTPNPTQRTLIDMATGTNDQIYVFDIDQTDVYSPIINDWLAPLPVVPTATDQHAVAQLPGGELMVLGGDTRSGPPTDRVAVLATSQATPTWSMRASMPAGRLQFSATRAGDGRVYAIGGHSGPMNEPIATVHAYSIQHDRWFDVEPLPLPRIEHASAVGADGRLYVMGGFTGVITASTVVYGPSFAMTPASAAPGTRVAISGTNFATEANVSLHIGDTLVGSGRTDSGGQLETELVVPALPSGTYPVSAVDARSQYVVRTRLAIN